MTGCSGLTISPASRSEAEMGPVTPLSIAWTYNARAGFGPDAPLIVNKTVIVATRQGEVHFIDSETGKRSGIKRFGDAINGSPVVIGTTLVVPVAKGRRALVAYDLNQSRTRWRIRGAPIQAGIMPLDSGGIFVNTDGQVQRFQAGTGTIVWTYQIEGYGRVHARPLAWRDLVILAVDNGIVLGLSIADGSLRWAIDLGDPVYVTPAVYEETLLVSTTQGRILALDLLSQNLKWDVTLSDENIQVSTPAADHELVVVGASDGALRGFDVSTGESMWTAQLADALVIEPLITKAAVYTGSMGARFYAIDRHSGDILQEIELQGRVKSAIGISDGTMTILSEPRYVIRLTSSRIDVEI